MVFSPKCLCGLRFGGVSLGGNFAKSQKMCDEGVLAKFAIAPLYLHFGSRGLQRNVVLCLHFMCVLIKRSWVLRQGLFVAYFLQEFPLVATLQNLRKCAIGCRIQICHSSALRALWEPRFAAKCCAMFALEVHFT